MVDFLGFDIGIWSLIISIIAITFVFLKDFLIPVIFKPKLELDGHNDGECVDDAFQLNYVGRRLEEKLTSKGLKKEDYPEKIENVFNRQKINQRWLRIRLKNQSGFFSTTAKNCYIKLIEIRNSKNQVIRPFNAFPLMWVQYATPKNNLAKGEYHLLDLAYESENERVIYPASWGKFGLPNNLLSKKAEKLGPDVYTFKLGVYGDNFNPIFKEIKVEFTEKFGELRFAE